MYDPRPAEKMWRRAIAARRKDQVSDLLIEVLVLQAKATEALLDEVFDGIEYIEANAELKVLFQKIDKLRSG